VFFKFRHRPGEYFVAVVNLRLIWFHIFG
jgi:hypothetical protein